MQDPRQHLVFDRERRADLVRQARRNELAERLAESRSSERRSLLERLRRRRRTQDTADAPAVPELMVDRLRRDDLERRARQQELGGRLGDGRAPARRSRLSLLRPRLRHAEVEQVPGPQPERSATS